MSVSLVQSAGSNSTNVIAFGSNNTSGNLLAMGIGMQGTGVSVSSVTDSAGNTWTKVYSQQATDTDGDTEVWICGSCVAGANTVTVHISGSTFATAIEIYELSGTSGAADQSQAIKSTIGGQATITPSQNGAFIISTVGWSFNYSGTTPTVGSGYTLDQSGTRCGVQHQTQVTAASVASSFGNIPGGGAEICTGIVSFVAPATTFSISGNAGVASANVAWTGTSSGSTTADGAGNYSITGLSNGTYTITPTLAGYTFSPTSQNETVSGSNITGVNFTATPAAGSQRNLLLIIQ